MDRPSDDYRPSPRRRAPDALEDGLDRLMTAGRQLVDGVSGARPGSRRRAGASAGAPLPRLGELGRWVEERLDGLLDGDDDDWREPWQEQRLQHDRPLQRRPLEAISRRNQRPASAAPDGLDWPDDAAFSVPRWQRSWQPERRPAASDTSNTRNTSDINNTSAAPGRPLPRSSRRRPDQPLGS